jgi:26S proteasome regulatory subunit N1
MTSTVHNENEPALAILSEYIESDKPLLRTTAIMGLGIAYTATNRYDLKEVLLNIVSDTSIDLQISSIATFALRQIFIGQGDNIDNDIASSMLQTLMEMEPAQLESPWIRFYGLGLALLFFGKQDASDAIVETLRAIDHPVAQEIIIMLSLSSFAGTGEVLRIQQMLRMCAEKPEKEEKEKDEKKEDEKKDEKDKEKKKEADKGEFKGSLAVLAIAAIAMGEDIGKELSMRHFGHLVSYLCFVTNPRCILVIL